MSDDNEPTKRRSVLKAVGIGAASAAGLASPAAASDVQVHSGDTVQADLIVESLDDVGTAERCTDEYKDYKCEEEFCNNYYTEYVRTCQDCEESGTTCTGWSETGNCCL